MPPTPKWGKTKLPRERNQSPSNPVGGQQLQLSTATVEKMPCTRGAESHHGGDETISEQQGTQPRPRPRRRSHRAAQRTHSGSCSLFLRCLLSFPAPRQPFLIHLVQEDTTTGQHCHLLFVSHTLTLFLSLFWHLEIYSTWRCIFQSPRLTWFNH